MAKKNNTPTPTKKVAPVTLCKSCKRPCKNLLMVVSNCGKYLAQ